jgi:hypothetical protein
MVGISIDLLVLHLPLAMHRLIPSCNQHVFQASEGGQL